MSRIFTANLSFKAKVVNLILSSDIEQALQLLSQQYKITQPNLKVGMPKRHSKKLACYIAKKRAIHVSSKENLRNPHIILHEFYHHLRNLTDKQKGVEKYAERFAVDYLQAHRIIAASMPAQRIQCKNKTQDM